MKLFIPFAILFFAVIMQAAFLKYAGLSGAFLNVVLVLLLCSVFFGRNYKITMLGALFAGLLLDGLSGLPFGYLAFSAVVSVFSAFALLSFVLRGSFWHFIFFTAFGAALYDVILVAVFLAAHKTSVISAGFSGVAGALAVGLAFNVMAAFLFYPLRRWIIL